jgi:hypothetical protein
LNNKPMFLLFTCSNDNRNNYKNETTDHHHHIWKVPNNQCTYRSNKYSESEAGSPWPTCSTYTDDWLVTFSFLSEAA